MVVNIYGDGRVTNHFDEFGKTIGKAVPVPPHGRLIDAEALMNTPIETEEDIYGNIRCVPLGVLPVLNSAPTIIEAEEET